MNTLIGARRRALARLPRTQATSRRLHLSTARQYLALVALTSTAWMYISFIAGLLTAVYALWARSAWLRHQELRRQQAAETACADAFAGFAADVRAGGTPEKALMNAAKSLYETTKSPFWPHVIAASGSARLVALLRGAPMHYRQCCVRLAAAWKLISAGITLAPILDSLETELRGRIDQRQRVAADTAGAKATAAVLLSLPIIGILMGYALGADPMRVLLHTGPGAGCALFGACLQYGGWRWANKLTSQPLAPARPKSQSRPKTRLRPLTPGGECAKTVPNTFAIELPYAVELFAAAINAGAPTSRAAALIGEVMPGPAGGWFTKVAGKLHTGMSPTLAWHVQLPKQGRRWFWAASPPAGPLLALARDVARASDSGAALVRALRTHAKTLRRRAELEDRTRAARASVALVLPLVCCFLPAFVLIGVVPLLIDLLGQRLGGTM